MTTDLERAAPPDPAARRTRRAHIARAVAIAAVVVHVLAAWLARPPGFLTGQDDAEYSILARSLRGGGYEELHRIDSPTHSTYPPGYPALLAVWGAVAGDDFDALVMLNVLLSASALLLLRRTLLRRGFDDVIATGSVAVLAVNPSLVALAGTVMSEPYYILLTIVCLWALADERPGARRLALACAAAFLAALTRSIGITLLGALALHWLLERRWKPLLALGAAGAVTVGAWLVWTVMAPEQFVGTSYVADLRTAVTETVWSPGPLLRAPGHAAWYARVAFPWSLGVPTVPGTPIDNAIVVLLLAVLGGVGLWTFFRRWQLAALYFTAYTGLLVLWIWRVERFVVPLLPLLVPALLVGAHAIGERLRMRRARLLPVALAVVLGGAALVRTGGDVADAARCDRTLDLPDPACLSADQASFFEGVRWIRDHTAPDAVILAAKSGPVWLYTGRRTVGYGAALSAGRTMFLPFLRERGADFVLLGALEQAEIWQLAPLLARVCREVTLRATFPPNTHIFELAGADAEGQGNACAALRRYLDENGDRLL
jgi:4-amino-4-deoxy-L-arabinose transferase-like glycosyltransferase